MTIPTPRPGGTKSRVGVPDAVRELVSANLGLHTFVHQCKLMEVDRIESAYIILWSRGEEWGTHRACVSLTDGMLVWGRYFVGPNAIVEAYRDYNKRIGEDT